MNLIKILFISIPILFNSCNSTTKSVETSNEKDVIMDSKKMIADGFIAGEISFSIVEGDCPITIKIEGKDGIYYYDPINLTEEFNKEGEKIWFTFARLRRVNRCEKAAPISIMEIQKRN